MSDAHPSISIAVATRNRADRLDRALAALVRQNYPPDRLEIIVVDDGSRDHTRTVVDRHAAGYPRLRYLSQSGRGPAAARNLAVGHARGEIVLFTDDDCVPDPDWVRELVRGFEEAHVGGVAGRIEFVPPGDNLGNRIAAATNGCGQPRTPDGQLDFIVTANGSFRKAVLEQVAGFDETFPHAVHEDVDLSHRVRRAGRTLRYVDGALVYHHHDHT